MINHWWFTRPKRALDSVPEVLAVFANNALNIEWEGQRQKHLQLEDALENSGLKRVGQRRDHTGGGGRTYLAWLKSLGLVFTQESSKKLYLTLAGEALMSGDSPVAVITNQVLKYQFPSSFSLGQRVNVDTRFKIHPFLFLLALLDDSRIKYLTQEEIAKIVITEAETPKSFEKVVARIIAFRNYGDSLFPEGYFEENFNATFDKLNDVANTIINWLNYTQLIEREKSQREGSKIEILADREADVKAILSQRYPLIDRPGQHEYFQRKYGIDPRHSKDTRNLEGTSSITPRMLIEAKVKTAYIAESLKTPITSITTELIDKITIQTGVDASLVEDILLKYYATGSLSAFMTEYFNMAFKGTECATEFEKATCTLFSEVFKFQTKHVGPIGLTPDVLIVSDADGYQAILDNKAYSKYSINNDHHNRMVHNYINGLANYSQSSAPLAFYSYIAGGFGNRINEQLAHIYDETGVKGSAITVSNMIKLVEQNVSKPVTHQDIRRIFSVGRRIQLSDFQ